MKEKSDRLDTCNSILFLGTQMAVGGAQQVLFSQANWFHEKGYKVYTAFFYDKENLNTRWKSQFPYPVIDLRAWRDGANLALNGICLILGLYRLWAFLRKEKVVVIETFTPDSNLLGLTVARLAKVPVRVASYHGLIEGRSRRFMRMHSWLVNRGFAKSIVAVSEKVRQIAIVEDGIKPEYVNVILNGIEPRKPQKPASIVRSQLQKELGFKVDDSIVLSVGRVTVQKGHTYLLDATVRVLEVVPNAKFVIAGDGHLRESLTEKIHQLGIKDSVFFVGIRTDIPELLTIADIFVMPSLWEGMPIALLEAMEFGVPVVTSNLDEISAFVIDGECGLLVEPGDVQALAKAIIQLLEDKSLRAKLGQAGRDLVHREYTVDRMCEQYEKLFWRLSR